MSDTGIITYDSGGDDRAQGIAIDASNNIYVAGGSNSATTVVARKYDANGDLDTDVGRR